MKNQIVRALAPAAILLMASACWQQPAEEAAKADAHAAEEKGGHPEGVVELSPQQIADAGIEVTRPTVGGVAGAIEIPATIEGDPQAVQVVAASVGGRVRPSLLYTSDPADDQ